MCEVAIDQQGNPDVKIEQGENLESDAQEDAEIVVVDDEEEKEKQKLGMYPPFKTLLLQSIGPFVQQIVLALYGMVDTFYVGKALGKDGLSAIGSATMLEQINNALVQYLSACLSARLGFLYGQKRTEECAQVVADFFRIAVVWSVLSFGIILPITKPIAKWTGADDHIANMSFQYMLPLTACAVLSNFYSVICGVLQSEGRSYLYGCCQFVSMLLNMLLFDPMFLLWIKTGIWGASTASILGSTLPMLALLVPLARGKFNVKPKLNMLLKKPSHESLQALKVGLPTMVALLSMCVPMLVVQKFIGNLATRIGTYNETISAFTVLVRIYNIVLCVDNALSQGFLPASSFAFGAQRLNRLKWLAVDCLIMGIIWNSVCEAIIMICRKQIAKVMIDDEAFIETTAEFLLIGTITMPLAMFNYVGTAILQTCKEVIVSMVLAAVTQLLPLPIFSMIIYYADPTKKPVNILLSFVGNDVFSTIVCLSTVFWKLCYIFKEEPSDMAALENAEDEDEDLSAVDSL